MSQSNCEACGDPLTLCPSCADYAKAARGTVTGIQGAEHAFAVGQLVGMAASKMKVDANLDANGKYENYFIMHTASRKWRVEVTPED